jgi:hypothetical protein
VLFFPQIPTPPQAYASRVQSPSDSSHAGVCDWIPDEAASDARTAVHYLSPPPPDIPASPQLQPRRSQRKRAKKVRMAPMTIAERRHYDANAAAPPSTVQQDLISADAHLQLEIADADDPPQHDEPDVPISNLQGSVDSPEDLAELMAPPSNFAIGSSSQSPLDTYRDAHESWFVRLILLVVAVLHTRHHLTFRACSLLLFALSLIFFHLSLTSSENRIPGTLDTVLLKLKLEDRFAVNPGCDICQRLFRPTIPRGSRCPDCNNEIFSAPSPSLFRRLTGKTPPPPPPKLSVPLRTLSSLLTDAFAHGPLEDQVQEWLSHTPTPGQYTGFMDGRVAQELKDDNGNRFFDPTSLIEGEIRLGVTWSVDWYVHRYSIGQFAYFLLLRFSPNNGSYSATHSVGIMSFCIANLSPELRYVSLQLRYFSNCLS